MQFLLANIQAEKPVTKGFELLRSAKKLSSKGKRANVVNLNEPRLLNSRITDNQGVNSALKRVFVFNRL